MQVPSAYFAPHFFVPRIRELGLGRARPADLLTCQIHLANIQKSDLLPLWPFSICVRRKNKPVDDPSLLLTAASLGPLGGDVEVEVQFRGQHFTKRCVTCDSGVILGFERGKKVGRIELMADLTLKLWVIGRYRIGSRQQ